MKLVKENLRKNEGFSLVEIIIAIFILSIIVASTVGAFLFSTKTTLDNEIRMNTINIANETIEKIRALPFSEVGTKFLREDGTYIDGDPAGDILQEEIRQINGIDYLVKVNINWEEQADWDLAGNAQWDYKSVRVSVTPQG
ncbi:MAG: prepilin-type N-terminal cleavage/methylation domain-containing protein, partial [Bacillota bacterium]|nr:prepilin-type N-terminal cleavage/methylation domain-containing protein [Bacillota bacterium]